TRHRGGGIRSRSRLSHMPDLLEPPHPGGGDRPVISDFGFRISDSPSKSESRNPKSEIPVLLFEQVSKWYGPVIGVNQVTLELRGGITGLVGANGAGKSTMLRLATGHLQPDIGRVTVRGVDSWSWKA